MKKLDISSAQAAAARAMLKLTTKEAAEKTGIAPNTINRFENDGSIHDSSRLALQIGYEALGVEFEKDGWVRVKT